MDIGTIVSEAQLPKAGSWYTLPETDVQVEIRVPTPGEMRKLTRECQLRGRAGRNGDVNGQKLHRRLLDMCVLGWKNIEKDGQPLPCTLENKQLLDDSWRQFSEYWQGLLTDDEESRQRDQEDQEKN